jgi:hypothetical protein
MCEMSYCYIVNKMYKLNKNKYNNIKQHTYAMMLASYDPPAQLDTSTNNHVSQSYPHTRLSLSLSPSLAAPSSTARLGSRSTCLHSDSVGPAALRTRPLRLSHLDQLSSHRQECFLHIGCVLGRCLQERNLEALSKSLTANQRENKNEQTN